MPELSSAIDTLVRKAPSSWLREVCQVVRVWPKDGHAEGMIASLPITHNGDLAFQIRELVRSAEGEMSWEALATSIEVCASVRSVWESEQNIELLWSGPSPANHVPARRIDQVLYDLLCGARRDILLVTFAAYKVKLLTEALISASRRNVPVRMILEFEQASLNQLSMDALKAFPPDLIAHAEIYYWPLSNREVNELGRPGKLHAKAAVVDDQALLSSANLTDDAFNRNLEIGALFSGGEIPGRLRAHFDELILSGTLARWSL
ncbi:MAG: DISARM system phospholipase D-like protein DrmC [Acidobacteriia bacterium]|nr:DISARM system phospholipase D-like protein DrmC [Terriglobia bacterium]